MLSEKDKMLIEQYARRALTTEEKNAFEQRLKQDSEFRQTALAEILMVSTLAPHPVVKAQKIVEALGDDLFADEQETENTQPHAAVTYTLKELFDLFNPVQHLEAEVNRSSALLPPESLQNCVQLPEDGIPLPNQALYFAFNPAQSVPIIVSILNNKEAEVALAQHVIPAGVSDFTVLLPTNLKPGIYYWRLRPDTEDRTLRRRLGVAVGNFFVQAHLKP